VEDSNDFDGWEAVQDIDYDGFEHLQDETEWESTIEAFPDVEIFEEVSNDILADTFILAFLDAHGIDSKKENGSVFGRWDVWKRWERLTGWTEKQLCEWLGY